MFIPRKLERRTESFFWGGALLLLKLVMIPFSDMRITFDKKAGNFVKKAKQPEKEGKCIDFDTHTHTPHTHTKSGIPAFS